MDKDQKVELSVKQSALVQELEGGIYVVTCGEVRRQSTSFTGVIKALQEAFGVVPVKRAKKEG